MDRVAFVGRRWLQPAKTVNGFIAPGQTCVSLYSRISNAKRFHFALAAFIKPVVAADNLSSLMLGSSRLPFYSPVSFRFPAVGWTRYSLYVTLPSVEPGWRRSQATSRAKTDQEKGPF